MNKLSKTKLPFIQLKQSLLMVSIINLSFSVLQIIVSIFARSSALLSDAVHNLGDSVSIILSYFAVWISDKKSDTKRTFGYKRAEIIASFCNGLALFITAIFLIIHASEYFVKTHPINTSAVIIFAIIGMTINLGSAFILHRYHLNSLNIRSVYLHLLSDGLTSLSVLGSGIAIHFFQIYWLDSITSILIALYIMYNSIYILKESIKILMQFAPRDIDIKNIEKIILAHDNIKSIHHLHLWQLNDSQMHLEVHITIKKNVLISETESSLHQIKEALSKHCNIHHTTLQIETSSSCERQELIIDGCC